MSDREGPELEPREIAALQAALFDHPRSMAFAAHLGAASLFAHVVWRRRRGALALLPA